MSRLVDYFVVVGYDHDKERAGKILQRFPEEEWPETPFHQGIEMFCQPQGWKTHSSPKVPEFLLSVLTDVDAYRHYCACLTFTEAFIPTLFNTNDEEDEVDPSQILYAPKSICIISRHEYFETFRQCLGIIYTVYLDKLPVKMEVLIGNLLGFIQVPPPGGPQIRFSLGADDRQCVQPPLLASIPISRDSIATFCQELGISNVMLLLSAALIDNKILVYSSSYSRLTNACHALTTLCYPLKYSYVYVPILPAPLLEVLNSPTPFIMGIHSSLKDQVADLLDVIFVDLDGCQVEIPENVTIPLPPEPMLSHTISSLKMVMDPSLLVSDHAFPVMTTGNANRSLPEMLDKEIRAVFIQFFCEIFAGYRSCLTVVRIHPEPFIQFQKAKFLGMRGLVGDEFVTKVVSSMSFGRFVHEYASPFRTMNIFDEMYAEHKLSMDPTENDELTSHRLSRIREIAGRLYTNENPHTSAFAQKLLRPSESAMMKPTPGYQFPRIDQKIVADIIQDGLVKQSQSSKWPAIRPQPNQVIPLGPNTAYFAEQIVAVNSARRLEVLSNCITHIFENRINDAKKLQPAVMRVLSNPSARLALSAELSRRVQSNRAMLDHQQFEMVVQLINCALQDDSLLDEYGVAASFLPLATAFCRKLCTGVIQFAYTRIQDHEIWGNIAFWESAFYKDVQDHITALYWPALLTSGPPVIRHNGEARDENGNKVPGSKSEENLKALSTSLTAPTALDIAADQIRSWNSCSEHEQRETIDREESTVFSQAIHYANRIVYLRVPLDASSSSRLRRRNSMGTDTQSNSNFTNSVQESDNGSMSEESGFQDEEKTSRESCGSVIRFVTKFVDKVCGESHVSEEHIRQLHQMIPGVVAMHIEGLEAVYRESKHLQPIAKPKITEPPLLPGEDFALDRPLRAHLLTDGREETSGVNGVSCLIPCDGALFLTTYRVIFMGSPVDQFVNSDYTIIRAFPLSALTKEKRLVLNQSPQGMHHSQSHECYQLRSATFQLIRVAFDDEVSSEHIDNFRRYLTAMRYPTHAYEVINQSLAPNHRSLTASKAGKKPATIKGFAKKTLLRTAQAAGIKTKSMKKDGKYFNPNATPLPDRRYQLTIASDGLRSGHMDDDASEEDGDTLGPTLKDTQSFERVIDRAYVKDFRRIGLISTFNGVPRRVDEFRLCQVNLHYRVCASYPALVIVPNSISDDTIRNLARNFKENRFPAITWQHPRTKALLIRSSTYHNARSVFKNSTMSTAGSMMTIPTNSHQAQEIPSTSQADFEKYLKAVINLLPGATLRHPSLSSVNVNVTRLSYVTGTPDSIRKSSGTPWNRAVQTLRTSTGKSGNVTKRSSALFPNDRSSSLSRAGNSELTLYSNGETDSINDDSLSVSRGANVIPSNLQVLCDKSSFKAIKGDVIRCSFTCLEYHDVRKVKSAYKRMLQVLTPSSKEASNAPQGGSFYRQIESLDWLKQVQRLMCVSTVVVELMNGTPASAAQHVIQPKSVMLALEEGWDATCQISALAQLLLDPKCRTIEGFAVLIEKEFSAFGHRFAHRNNLTHATKDNGIAPIFVQFLDCVHQIHRQFPMSFEFNMYFLKFLAYHSMSNRFTNFLTDSEAERVELGLLDSRKNASAEMDISHWPVTSGSIWDYIDCVNKKNPKFFNFLYTSPSTEEDDTVLCPQMESFNLTLWDFYLDESLAFGSLYDLELIDINYGPEPKHNVGKDSVRRRFVNNCYNNASLTIVNSFSTLFDEIAQLQSELGMEQTAWEEQWENFDQDGQLIVPIEKAHQAVQMIRSQSRRLQTQITLDILDKSKNGENASQALGHPHRFVRETFTTPTYCNQCTQVLWGNGKLAVVCADCGFHAHEKCSEQVGNTCIKIKVTNSSDSTSADLDSTSSVNHFDQLGSGKGETLRDISPTTPMKSQYSEQNSISQLESRAIEGFLHKRGAVLKGWKLKYFILDSMQHQLQYFEMVNGIMDPHTRGSIDLAEVVSVGPSTTSSILSQGAPKKFDFRACFDVKTNRRTYNLCAKDPAIAQEWIEKIQLYLQ